jgi:integrase
VHWQAASVFDSRKPSHRPSGILVRLVGRLSARTVNQTIKILKRPFKIAVDQGLIDRNPVAAIRTLRSASAKKSVFTPEQIQKLVDSAKGDWKGLILTGYFTGGWLCDLARLTWDNVGLEQRTIAFTQKKTGSAVLVPIHPDLPRRGNQKTGASRAVI